jgi:1-acyl-sn-glycerol-3-phosphate acyltransferase
MNSKVFPVAAGDTFFETPVAAAFASLFMNALPLWRRHCGAHALEDLRKRLVEEPCGYILFPEGSRSRTERMASFKPGVGRLVAGTGVPVIPCHLKGTYAALPPQRHWPRPVKIRLRLGSPLVFSSATNDREGWRTIARVLEEAVRELGSG